MSPLPRSGTEPLCWPGLFLCALALWGCADPQPVVLAGAATNSFLNGIRLAVEDDVREHGPLPGLDTLLVQETSNRSAPALEVAYRLVATPGVVAVVGHANSAASLAASQVYGGHRITQIAPTSSAALYSRAGPFSFRMVPPDPHQGAFLVRMLADSVSPAATVAVLHVSDDYGRGLREAVLADLDRDRFPVVLDLPHTEGDIYDVDAPQLLDAIEASGAEVILWLGRPPALADLLPALRERLGEVPILGGDALSRAALFTEELPWWDGVRYVDFVDMDASPELRDFGARYQARFGADAGGPEALSYDAARLVLAAVRAGARSGDEVRAHLAGIGRDRPAFQGITGAVTFDEHGDVEGDYVLRTIVQGASPQAPDEAR